MQGKDQCFTCGKEFNKNKNHPKRLSCSHVICLECAIRLYQPQKQITCPWCSDVTKVDPHGLDIAFIPGEQPMKSKECANHKGQEKILFCQEDQEAICLICANFGEQHQGHTIKDILDVKQKFQGNEFKQAMEQKEAAEEMLYKYEKSLQEEKSKASENLERYIVAITAKSEKLIEKVKQVKNERVESLTKEWKLTQNKYEIEEQKIEEIKRLIQFSQPEDQENISELIYFVGKMQGIAKQVQNLKSFSIEVEFNQNIDKVLENLEDFVKFRITEREIAFESQIFHPQELQQIEIVEEFKNLRTIQKNSKSKKTYSTINSQFSVEEQNIQSTNGNATQIQQFQEDGLIISGGNSTNQNRFTLHTQNQTQEFQMKNKRLLHRTNQDGKNSLVYIISGYSNNYVKECEMFNLKTQSFHSINPIETPVFAFGSGLKDYSDLYTFGGYSSNGDVDKIQVYESKINSWKTCQQKLPTAARTTAIFLQKQQVFLIYKNGVNIDTLAFDLHQITKHGTIFNGYPNSYVFTQPILNQNFVYQFDSNTDLFRYDLASGNWNQV